MKKKFLSIINRYIPVFTCLGIVVIWQIVSFIGIVPKFMLPSPMDVGRAFISDLSLLLLHARVTLVEAFFGLLIGTAFGFLAAALMDFFPLFYKGFYPIVVLTQTIPTIAIAPLLVLWMGYEMAPKITLIVIATFFPITIGLLNGFSQVDKEGIKLFKAMGATKMKVFLYLKLPGALSHFFSGLRISAAYALVGAVISEWLGGYFGLGVYMVRVKKSFSFDKMFAVIFLISALSLVLMWLVDRLHKVCMPWEKE